MCLLKGKNISVSDHWAMPQSGFLSKYFPPHLTAIVKKLLVLSRGHPNINLKNICNFQCYFTWFKIATKQNNYIEV